MDTRCCLPGVFPEVQACPVSNSSSCDFLAVWPGASSFPSLCLGFRLCTTERLRVSAPQGGCEVGMRWLDQVSANRLPKYRKTGTGEGWGEPGPVDSAPSSRLPSRPAPQQAGGAGGRAHLAPTAPSPRLPSALGGQVDLGGVCRRPAGRPGGLWRFLTEEVTPRGASLLSGPRNHLSSTPNPAPRTR